MLRRNKSSTVVVKPFCKWASAIDPSIVLAPGFMSSVISPLGSKAGDAEWEFSKDYIPRGSRANRTLSFEFSQLDLHLRPESNIMARQYALLLAAEDNSIRSLATLKNRVQLNNRLIGACGNVTGGDRLFASMSLGELSDACKLLQDDWTESNSDYGLLRKIIEEVTSFHKRGLLADGYTSHDCSECLFELSSITLSESLDALRNRVALPKYKDPSVSTLPFSIEWVNALLPIARCYIELAPHITRHLEKYEELRREITRNKQDCVKKVIGRAITKAYIQFAKEEIEAGKWTRRDGTPFLKLPFETDGTIVFPPRHTSHLLALVSSLQIVCFQIVALISAARLSELHTVSTSGISQSDHEEPIYAIHGLIFKGTGTVGYRRHKWIVSQEAVEAIRVQERLFKSFRSGPHLWCQTALGSLGEPMCSSEQVHLVTFVRRHLLTPLVNDGKISTRRFRKTWAELAMISNLSVELIRQQLGHAPSEGGISDQTAGYMFSDRESSLRFQLANSETFGPSAEMECLMKEVFKK
jgi:hypothetical protein